MSVVLERERVGAPVKPDVEVKKKPDELVVLEQAYDLLKDPNRWCSLWSALDKEGEVVEPTDEAAERFCALGAIYRFTYPLDGLGSGQGGVYDRASSRLAKALGYEDVDPDPDNLYAHIVRVNDRHPSGYDRIIAGLKQAIRSF